MTAYADWTYSDVRARVVEAAEVLMLDERVGPRAGSAWPLIVREMFKDEQPSETITYRRMPSASELTRMMETWDWINALPNESDRRLLYAWAWVKARKGRSVEEFATEQGANSRKVRGWIAHICQGIADRLNRNSVIRRSPALDVDAGPPSKTAPNPVASPKRGSKSPGYQRAADAKPRHDPEHPELKKLIRRLERQNRKRARSKSRGESETRQGTTGVQNRGQGDKTEKKALRKQRSLGTNKK